jgi:hypothetical protein
MDNLLIILISILILFVFVLIGLLAYFGNRFLKIKELEAKSEGTKEKVAVQNLVDKNKVTPELLTALRSSSSEKAHSLYCIDHPDEFAKGKCAISGEFYCMHCLTKQGDVKISKKYLDLYLDNEWIEVSMIPNDENNLDLKERILKMKQHLWDANNLPLIVQGHYKINVQDDQIEEYTVLFARKEDEKFIKKELSFIQ